MKKIFLILLFPIFLFASYEVVVASLRYKSGIEKIKKRFGQKEINVYKKGDLNIVAIGDFKTKKEALNFLKEVKKEFPSAFVRTKKENILIQIAALSNRKNASKIEKKFPNLKIFLKKGEKLYKVYASFKNKNKALKALKEIQKEFPSAFIVEKNRIFLKKEKMSEKENITILVGGFKKDFDKVLIDLIDEDSYVKKVNNTNYLFIVNIPSLEKAKEKLKELQKKYPKAKIVDSFEIEEEKPKEILKEQNTTSNKSVKKIQEVASQKIKSLKEENTTEKNKSFEHPKSYQKTKEEENNSSIFNSKTILKIRKNYVNLDRWEENKLLTK